METTFEKAKDSFIKITIPNLGIVTWAKNIEDAKLAITEAVEAFKINANKYGEGYEKEMEKAYEDITTHKYCKTDMLKKLEFKSKMDQFVFEHLPLTNSQKEELL